LIGLDVCREHPDWIGLDWIYKFTEWIELGLEKCTYVQLCDDDDDDFGFFMKIFISPVGLYGSGNTAVKSETTILIQKKIKTTVTMTFKDYTTGYIKTDKTVTYELYSLQNYTDANTISLYDSKTVVKEYEAAAPVAAC